MLYSNNLFIFSSNKKFMFSQIEENFMRVALNEAKNCYSRGDLPVGAVLTINDNLEGVGGNSAKTNRDWTSHAEISLLSRVSWKMKGNPKGFPNFILLGSLV